MTKLELKFQLLRRLGSEKVEMMSNESASLLVRHLLVGGGPQERKPICSGCCIQNKIDNNIIKKFSIGDLEEHLLDNTMCVAKEEKLFSISVKVLWFVKQNYAKDLYGSARSHVHKLVFTYAN